MFRLSDPEETNLMLKLYNVDETPLQPLLDAFGYKDMERCLFLGFTDGEKATAATSRATSPGSRASTAACR